MHPHSGKRLQSVVPDCLVKIADVHLTCPRTRERERLRCGRSGELQVALVKHRPNMSRVRLERLI